MRYNIATENITNLQEDRDHGNRRLLHKAYRKNGKGN